MSESRKELLLRMARENGDFVEDNDGYWVYWPTRKSLGSIGAPGLRILADELDRMNAEWDRKVRAFFENEGVA